MKVKKILECICINCGKLKANIVSRVSLSSTRFAPPPSQISGGSLHIVVNPKPAPRQFLEHRGVPLPMVLSARVFGRLIAASAAWCWPDTRLRGEMGGRTRSAKIVHAAARGRLSLWRVWLALSRDLSSLLRCSLWCFAPLSNVETHADVFIPIFVLNFLNRR